MSNWRNLKTLFFFVSFFFYINFLRKEAFPEVPRTHQADVYVLLSSSALLMSWHSWDVHCWSVKFCLPLSVCLCISIIVIRRIFIAASLGSFITNSLCSAASQIALFIPLFFFLWDTTSAFLPSIIKPNEPVTQGFGLTSDVAYSEKIHHALSKSCHRTA